MTVRERIWKVIDDAALEGHLRLQDALYRLLVVIDAVECVPSCVDDCLEHADQALRDGGVVAVTRVEDLVATLTMGISSAPSGRR